MLWDGLQWCVNQTWCWPAWNLQPGGREKVQTRIDYTLLSVLYRKGISWELGEMKSLEKQEDEKSQPGAQRWREQAGQPSWGEEPQAPMAKAP